MTNIPQKIYLQVDADGETPEDFKGLRVTWSATRVFDNDIEYVLASAKDAEIERLKGLIEKAHAVGWVEGHDRDVNHALKSWNQFKEQYKLNQ